MVGGTAVLAVGAAMALAGCSSDGAADGKVTITLTGPNQFTADTDSFGPAWDGLVAAFEKENPDITLKTNVLPIASWNQASTTQLSAGTATELIFNQTTHKPNQVHSLNEYLEKPNPFIPGNEKWMDAFNDQYFGGEKQLGVNSQGNYEWIPFNLVGIAIYYNEGILKEAGVDPADLSTFSGFVQSCSALKSAGYVPLATDNGPLAQGWEMGSIASTLFDDVVADLNQFDNAGNPGTADPIAPKSVAKGVLTGDLDLTTSPQVTAAFTLLKELNDECATPNWSGVSGSGAFTGGTDFQAGKAAMAWGTNFASTNLSDSDFTYGTITFPTVEKADTQYASGEGAQFGVSTGGTSYMIPSYIKGEKLDAAVKFLQFVSSPNVQTWLNETGSIPAINDLETPPGLDAFTDGRWAGAPPQGQNGAFVELPAALAGKNPYEGYLLGSTSLKDALATAQKNNVTWANEQVKDAGWTEDWTK